MKRQKDSSLRLLLISTLILFSALGFPVQVPSAP